MRAKEFLIDHLILEEPEAVRAQIVKRVGKLKDEDDLSSILQYTNQFSFKKDVGTLSSIKGFQNVVSNVILQAVGKVDAPEATVRAFLKRLATDGVIKEDLLLTTGQVHSMDQIVDSKFLPIFQKIKLDLFEKISGKIGEKGDVGKGEYLLAILSPRIERRGAPGDLSIAGVKVELKAGESGRLGPAGSQALSGRFDEFIALVTKAKLVDPNIEIPAPTSFNFSLNMSAFSAFFGNDQAKVQKALGIMLKMHFPGQATDALAKAVVNGGQIDGPELKRQMLAMAYLVYQGAKEFDGVLLTDYGINRYLYMNSPQSAADASPFLVVKWPSWTDTQSNCMKIQLSKRA
jgi:hypothetical protein